MGRLLRYPELNDLKGIRYTRDHLSKLEQAGKFPRRIRLSARMMGWDEEEIDAYLNAKRAARHQEPPGRAPQPPQFFRRVKPPV